ncbi:MAG: choice-of-anchor X domain-containing protein [Thermoanaerobaculaceae bacterium]
MKKLLTIAACLLISGWVGAADWGYLQPAPLTGPGFPGPLHSSKFYVTTAKVTNGQAEVVLPLTKPHGAFAVVLGDRPSRARVRGKALPVREFFEPELEAIDLSPEGFRFELSSLSVGEHKLLLEGLTKPAVQVVVAEPESPVTLALQAKPLAVRTGEPVTVTAQVADMEPVAQAFITARLSTGGTVMLRDDGQGVDEVAGDGVFTGSFLAPEVEGMQGVELWVEARGRRSLGERFARVATAAVMVTKPAGGLSEDPVLVGTDALEVGLLPATGRYRVEVIYAAADTSFAWAQEELQLSGQAARVRVPRPKASWGADKALVRLLNLDTMGLEAEVEVPLMPLASPPDFAALAQKQETLPPSKLEAARRFGDSH